MRMFVFIAVVSLAAHAQAYSSGAPEDACGDMVPRHPVPAQSTPSPYTIIPSTKTVKAGSPMEVVISGKSSKDTIRGLLLQARHGDTPVGTFTVAPDDKFAQLLNCGGPGSAVTHKKHDESLDKQTVSYVWTPPANFKGDIKFRATIARNGAVFWVGVESAKVTVN